MAHLRNDGNDQRGVPCKLNREKYQREYLLPREGLSIRVHFLIGACLPFSWGEVLPLFFVAAGHVDYSDANIIATSSILQMNGEKDSVVNFLTPTKLITSSLKPKHRMHQNDSLFSHSSKNKPNIPLEQPNKNYNSQFQRLNYGFNRSQEEVDPARPELADSRDVYSVSQYNKNYTLENANKMALKSEDNFRPLAADRAETRSQHPPQGSFVLHKVEVSNDVPPEPFVKLIDNSGVQQGLRGSAFKQRQPSNYETDRLQYAAGYTQGLESLIMQLKNVKANIEDSLRQLQNVLDNTSQALGNIDAEYARIKQRVLDFTAQALDAGFTRYRQEMVNWNKYEQVQAKSKLILQQLDKHIREDEVMVQQMGKIAKNSRLIFSKQAELNEKIALYSNCVSELARTKVQCLSHRPQLKRDRILAFQEAVTGLADF